MGELIDRDKFLNWLVINVAAPLFNLWFSTCRIKILNKELHDRYVFAEGGGVGATWHRNAIFLVWFFRNIQPMIMFSRSKDGELIASFAEKLGVVPVRGSSSSGGQSALRGMIDFMNLPGIRKVATVLDGPRGPRCVAKRGMILLAKESGHVLMPIMCSAYPAITLKKTWDKTMIPLPFSKIIVSYRDPWFISKDISREDFEILRQNVEDTLNDMMREADANTGYKDGN